MSHLRKASSKMTGLKEAFNESMQPVINTVNARFESMKLKDDRIKCKQPASEEAVQQFKDSIHLLDSEVDLSKLRASDVKTYVNLTLFIEKHCKSSCYGFQIKKCRDDTVHSVQFSNRYVYLPKFVISCHFYLTLNWIHQKSTTKHLILYLAPKQLRKIDLHYIFPYKPRRKIKTTKNF